MTAADNASHTNYAYYGSTTVVTDPAGNWKAMATGVDGNLKSVIEPDPAYNPSALASAQSIDCISTQAPSGMLGTCYTYDVFKNLTQVTMPRGNGTQTRTFTYQSGTNWLLTATNPENGTVTYTRDGMGHVTKRVDAMGQATNYTYDSYYRLTQVSRTPQWQRPDPCQTESYYYDQSIDSTFPSGASWGKLTAVLFGYGTGGTGVCPATAPDSSNWGGITYEYQYSSAGRVTGKRMIVQRQPYQGQWQKVNLDAYWTYDNEGKELSVTYPVVTDPNSGNPTSTAYNFIYDNMGRPTEMTEGYPVVNGLPSGTHTSSDGTSCIPDWDPAPGGPPKAPTPRHPPDPCTGCGGGGSPPGPHRRPGTRPNPYCSQGPLPPGIGPSQTQQNVAQAKAEESTLLSLPGETGAEGAAAFVGWLMGEFLEPWNYKNSLGFTSSTNPSSNYQLALQYGNFNFGAVMQGLGFTLTQTQQTAGAAQVLIWAAGGSIESGVPYLVYPYADQQSDEAGVLKGYDYELNVGAGACH